MSLKSGIKKDKDVTILVNSCDLYEDAWNPFFRLLQIQWPECPYDIVLNTENKTYNCEFMDVKTIKTGNEPSWTARLKSVLNQIDSEYVLFFLEDFFLLEPVRIEVFSKALEIIKNDKKVGLVHFVPTEISMHESGNDIENCFYELPVRKHTLRTRVAVSLFRKEYFLRLLYENENPWQYERESHIRSMFAGYKIVRQNYDLYTPAFKYILDHDYGIGITARKWLKNNKAFFESMGIYDVNYDRLGILEDKERHKMKEKKIEEIGFKNWFYNKVTHPIKRKIRHVWFIQDLLNLKKYIKYWRYYKQLDKNKKS